MLHDEYNELRSVNTKAPVFADVFNSQVSISFSLFLFTFTQLGYEYVRINLIQILQAGRDKEAAKKRLHVFLGIPRGWAPKVKAAEPEVSCFTFFINNEINLDLTFIEFHTLHRYFLIFHSFNHVSIFFS